MKTVQLVLLAFVGSAVPLSGCQATSHPTTPAAGVGFRTSGAALEEAIDAAGPITVETVVGADWVVDRAGLVNLEHPKAKAAHLADGDEPIEVIFHAIRHPSRGLFLVDTGVERAFRDAPKKALISGLTGKLAHLEKMKIGTPTGDWVARQNEPVRGVFLTHVHLDHVLGLRDVPASATVYVGDGDATERSFENLFASGIYDDAFAGRGPLQHWSFVPDPTGMFAGILDVFGDGSFWAISVPGHTAGSTAYLARTPSGPVLLTGDACHTEWGWKNGVEPGSFSQDKPRSAKSLASLEELAVRHPALDVRLGHQGAARFAQALKGPSMPRE